MTFAIGTPVIGPSGSRGFIASAREPETQAFVIGAGMREILTEYEICFESGRIEFLGDGIVAPFVRRAEHLPHVENVAERREAIKELEAENRAKAQRERAEMMERHAAFRAEARERTPSWAQAVIVAEYVEDRSDIMTDYHGSATMRTVILGFSRHARDLFPEMRKFAATFEETAHLADAPANAEHREKYSMGGGYYLKTGWRNSTGWQVSKVKLYGSADSVPVGEWHLAADEKPDTAEAAPVSASGMRIEEHTHTKKGFQMHIAILGERVEREEFDRLRDRAKDLGGWYSRPWGGTPGGFAFKDRANAESFIGSAAPVDSGTALPEAPTPGRADKLRELAERMQKEVDSKFAPRQTNTPKRRREADSARLDGYHLDRTRKALIALAALHDTGTVPPELAKVTTKARALELMRSKIDRSNAGYYDAGIDTGEPANTSPEALALWALVDGPSDDEKRAEELRRKVDALQFANIPGYFPTPTDIIARMIHEVGIPEGEPVDVLEPEAGSGAILDAVKAARPLARLHAYERHLSLREVLKLKGYSLSGADFMESPAAPSADYVLMNPPFEKGQDIEHVRHAFAHLRPGGRLVAIMSPGPFFRSDRKAEAFREWFEGQGGEKQDIPAGAFKASGTGVATVLVTIRA